MAALVEQKGHDLQEMDFSGLSGVKSVENILKSKKEMLVMSDDLVKINHKQKRQPRTILITNAALYNLKGKNYECKRRIPIEKITSLTSSNMSGELVVHVLAEYDYRFVIKELHKDRIIKIVRKQFKALTGKALKVDYAMQPELGELTWTKRKVKQDPERKSYMQRLEQLDEKKDENISDPEDEPSKCSPIVHESHGGSGEIQSAKIGVRDFEMLKVIGRGGFGKVLVVKKIDTGVIYAMKILKKAAIKSGEQKDLTVTERTILQTVNHPFLAGLRFAFQTSSRLYFVTDFYKGGDLFFHLRITRRFTEDQARFILAEIILALGHLHSLGFAYRDLKPENILFDEEGHICLTDFGLAKSDSGKSLKTFCGTPGFLAPEILKGQGYSKAVDWWACGILLYEMTVGIPPFHSSDLNEIYHKILHGSLRFPAHLSSTCRDLIILCLNRNPEKRIGSDKDVEDLKQHSFFESIDWNLLAEKKLSPVFKPKLQSDATDDTSAFDKEFVNQPVEDTPSSGDYHSKGLTGRQTQEWVFDGFTFVQSNTILEEDEQQI
jgi:serum/glucocorticoid-regulated kinase 2